MTDWLMDFMTDWLMDWLTDHLLDCRLSCINSLNLFFIFYFFLQITRAPSVNVLLEGQVCLALQLSNYLFLKIFNIFLCKIYIFYLLIDWKSTMAVRTWLWKTCLRYFCLKYWNMKCVLYLLDLVPPLNKHCIYM